MYVELAAPVAVAGGGRVRAARPPLVRRIAAASPPYLFLLPAVGCLIVWTYRPLVQTVQLSFDTWNLLPTTPIQPAGLSNYHRVFHLPELGTAALNTLWYVLGLLPFSVLLPVVIALLVRRVRGRAATVYRALIFVPTLVTPIVTATVWLWLLDPTGGPVHKLLHAVGIGPDNWFGDPTWALLAIIGITGWQMLGFAVLIVSAGLSTINGDYAAAAESDGASRRQVTWRITLPLLSPSLLFLVLMTILLSAQWTFPLIDSLTQGGPDNGTTSVYYLLWQFGFNNFDAGFAAAAGIVFFLVFAAIALVFVRLADRFSFHDN